jgi:hypothetical protein
MRHISHRPIILLAAAALTMIAACTDMTAPTPVTGPAAVRDTIPPVEGDSTLCRSGYHIIGGRIICDGSGQGN